MIELKTHALDTRFLFSGKTYVLRGFTASRPSDLITPSLKTAGGAGVRMAEVGRGCLRQRCLTQFGLVHNRKIVWEVGTGNSLDVDYHEDHESGCSLSAVENIIPG